MSAAKSSRKPTAKRMAKTSMASPVLSTMANEPSTSQDCGCGNSNCGCCCNKQTATICFTIDTSFLQNLVNMLPKVNITSQSGCQCNGGCECEECSEEQGDSEMDSSP
ncbi:MAG: hypothetical protein ABSF83_04755 [Nitrososphaerales archaeon]